MKIITFPHGHIYWKLTEKSSGAHKLMRVLSVAWLAIPVLGCLVESAVIKLISSQQPG